MRDPKRIPRMLEKLRVLWESAPDLRLGQLIENAKQASKGSKIDTFSVEDNLTEEGLDWLLEHVAKPEKGAAFQPDYSLEVQLLEERGGKALVRLPNGSKTTVEYADLDRDFQPDWYSPPGDTIEAVMKERGMTLDQFAEKMGQHPLWCSSLLCGSERIDEPLAQKLSEVIGSTPQFWLRREETYRKDKKRITGSD